MSSIKTVTVKAGQEATLTYGDGKFARITCNTGMFVVIVRPRAFRAPELTITPVGPARATGKVVTSETPAGYAETITDIRKTR